MIRIALFVASIFIAINAAHANEWSVDAMNRTINQTNFIVDDRCSGTLISAEKRLILTNFHCVEAHIETINRETIGTDGFVKDKKQIRYSSVPVSQNRYSGYSLVSTTRYISEIVAQEKKRDLALVQISGEIEQKYASPLLPEKSKINRGERIYIVGNPAMQDASVVEGIVSNVNRTFEFPWTGGEKTPMIQFSGGLYGGNSGGALYNAGGELIGVPSAGFPSATFIGLAIPITTVRLFLREHCFASIYDSSADDEKCAEKKKEKDKSSE